MSYKSVIWFSWLSSHHKEEFHYKTNSMILMTRKDTCRNKGQQTDEGKCK
jgi:hypothetical protein